MLRPHRLPLVPLLLLALPPVLGCPAGAGPDGGGPDDGAEAGVDAGPGFDVDATAVCTAGTRFDGVTAAFVEKTVESGLAALAVEGTRIAVADVDGDGRPDLFVRRGGVGADDFAVDGVRRSWLLLNTGGAFVDVTESSGVTARRGAGALPARPYEVVAFADVDNDGDQDLYTGLPTASATVADGETSEVLLNDGAGHFTLGPADNDARRAGEVDNPAGATFLDANLDGVVDLFVGQHNTDTPTGIVPQQDRLYLGRGDGTFEDATAVAGLTTQGWTSAGVLNDARAHNRAWSTGACDLNDDGLPELFVGSYGRSPNHLWQGGMFAGAPSYTNRSVASGYAYDDDLTWQDNQFARCYCTQNPSAEGCAGVPASLLDCSQVNWSHGSDREPYRLGGNSATTVCGDLDNDGDLDLFTTEIKHWWAGAGSDGSEVLLNTGEADVRFERPGDDALGLAIPKSGVSWDEGHMTAALLDFDNDGRLDLYLGASDYAGNRGHLYHQQGPLEFVDVDPAQGILHHRSHGVGVLDFDGDGDLDVVVGHSRARCDASGEYDCYETAQVRLFENVLGQDGNWLALELVGTTANRAGVGARVTVTTDDGTTRTAEVTAGHGHYGAQEDRVLHFGLGASCAATVDVTWPGLERTTETYRLPAGHRIKLTEGAGASLVDVESP